MRTRGWGVNWPSLLMVGCKAECGKRSMTYSSWWNCLFSRGLECLSKIFLVSIFIFQCNNNFFVIFERSSFSLENGTSPYVSGRQTRTEKTLCIEKETNLPHGTLDNFPDLSSGTMSFCRLRKIREIVSVPWFTYANRECDYPLMYTFNMCIRT